MNESGRPTHALHRYAAAALAMGVVLAAKFAFTAATGVETPFPLFLAGVLWAAWNGGVGPGLFATLLGGTAVVILYLAPTGELRIADREQWLRLLQFLAEGAFVSVLSGMRRQSAEQAHRRLEELRVTLLGIGNAVFATDAAGRVQFLNPVGEQLVGQTAAACKGRKLGDLLHLLEPDSHRPAACPADRALRGEVVHAAEFRYTRPDGSPAWLRVNAAPTRDRSGRHAGAVVALADVTCEKEAERDLRRSNDALEYRLATIAEDERRRISRELHDETSQRLTALTLGLKGAREMIAKDPAGAAGILESLQVQAGQISRALHRIAWELRPAALDDMGLETALRDAAGRWADQSGKRIRFHSTIGPRRLPPDVETNVYRIVNEAVANALRHSDARQVGIMLDEPDGELRVIVEDDGKGFDPDATRGRRLGLQGMGERAALIGGAVEVESEPGRGTTVFVSAPLKVREAET